jgi:hypothetical protein
MERRRQSGERHAHVYNVPGSPSWKAGAVDWRIALVLAPEVDKPTRVDTNCQGVPLTLSRSGP